MRRGNRPLAAAEGNVGRSAGSGGLTPHHTERGREMDEDQGPLDLCMGQLDRRTGQLAWSIAINLGLGLVIVYLLAAGGR